jgi:hypothetical protein
MAPVCDRGTSNGRQAEQEPDRASPEATTDPPKEVPTTFDGSGEAKDRVGRPRND